MFRKLFKKKNNDLVQKCRKYLEVGPPKHMTDYVPESLTEIIIAHGANKQQLDGELSEIASLILLESGDFANIDDKEIREYMLSGVKLVREILENQ